MKGLPLRLVGLLLASFLTTQVAHADLFGGGEPEQSASAPDDHAMPPHERLPEAQRKLVIDTIKKVETNNASLVAQEKALHEKLKTIVTADNFDSAAFSTTSAQLDTVNQQMQQQYRSAFLAIADKFKGKERGMVAMMFMMHGHHHPGGEHPHGHHPHPGQGPDGEPATPPAK